MSLNLTATTHTLKLTTSDATATVDWFASASSMTTTAFTPLSSQGTVTGAASTTIVAAPADASTQVGIKSITLRNTHATLSQGCTVYKDVSATQYTIYKVTLLAGEAAEWSDATGWRKYSTGGAQQEAEMGGPVDIQIFQAAGAAT